MADAAHQATRQRLLASPRLLLVGLGTLIVPLDGAVNTAFPAITAHFDIPIPAIQWVVICYVLTHASLMLACGRIGDVHGHRSVFRIGLAWSAVAYLLCATAPSYGWLLACRVLQGIGAALVLSCAPALATSLFPEAMRPRVLAAWATMFAAGGVIGPSLGGVLVETWGWEAVYWIRTPVALVALAFSHTLPRPAVRAGREPFDIAGAVLLALGLSTLLLALNRLRADPALAAVLGAAALLLLGLFIRQELRHRAPVIDLRLFGSTDFTIVNLGSGLVQFAIFAVPLIAPYFFARSAGLPVLTTGALLATAPLAAMLVSPVAGLLVARIPAGAVVLAGAALMALGLFGTSRWTADIGVPGMAASLLVQGCGMGLFQVAYLEIVSATVPPANRGVAGGLVQLTRTVGVVSAATILMLIFQGEEAARLASGAPEPVAFVGAFHTTFLTVACLPALVAAIGLARGLRRRAAGRTSGP